MRKLAPHPQQRGSQPHFHQLELREDGGARPVAPTRPQQARFSTGFLSAVTGAVQHRRTPLEGL